ncbi:hypothetical protein GEMRC1_007260 [Eukaryota sp. GEM-RC1]
MFSVHVGQTQYLFPSNTTLSCIYTYLSNVLPCSFVLRTPSGSLPPSASYPFSNTLIAFLPVYGGFGQRNLENNFKKEAKAFKSLPSVYGKDIEGRRVIEVSQLEEPNPSEPTISVNELPPDAIVTSDESVPYAQLVDNLEANRSTLATLLSISSNSLNHYTSTRDCPTPKLSCYEDDVLSDSSYETVSSSNED